MVDEAGFPRITEEATADAISWSPDGPHLLARHPYLPLPDYPLPPAPAFLPSLAQCGGALAPGGDAVDRGEWARIVRLVWHAPSQRLWLAGGFGVATITPSDSL